MNTIVNFFWNLLILAAMIFVGGVGGVLAIPNGIRILIYDFYDEESWKKEEAKKKMYIGLALLVVCILLSFFTK